MGLPTTSSGKLSRSRAKANYLAGLYAPPPGGQDRRGVDRGEAGRGHRRHRLRRPPSRRRPGPPRLEVRLLVRRWSPLPSLEGVAADMVLGDLLDEAALKRLVEGADAVVHAAGLIKARRPSDFMAVNRDGTALLSALAPEARSFFCRLWRRASPSSRPMPRASARRRRWSPAVGALAHGACTGGLRPRRPRDPGLLQGRRPRARTAAQGGRCPAVADPRRRPRRGAGACPRSAPPPSNYEIDDGRDGGYSYRDMADAAGRASVAGRCRSPCRGGHGGRCLGQCDRPLVGGSVQILTPGKVGEIFHSDWTAHDRRLAAALGFVRASIWRPALTRRSCGTAGRVALELV